MPAGNTSRPSMNRITERVKEGGVGGGRGEGWELGGGGGGGGEY